MTLTATRDKIEHLIRWRGLAVLGYFNFLVMFCSFAVYFQCLWKKDSCQLGCQLYQSIGL
jgi:hypothetical protein